ncbi:MAG: superoxide dismutase family protein [Planctomycetota bacterium]
MSRSYSILAVLFAVGVFAVLAQANPLAQIKEAANNTRDSAEQRSEEDAAQAEGNQDNKDPVAEEHPNHARSEAQAKLHNHDDDHDHGAEVYHAIAVMIPTEGNATQGIIRFDEDDHGVTVTATITGLNPNQKHGFHIHEFGDLSSPDGSATGGHYKPESQAGDLGNLQADEHGHATYAKTFNNLTIFDDDQNPILGRGVIIHAQENDGEPRIAQGIIGVANTK